MHGLVALGADDAVLRPAILWNDQRTGAECAEIEERVGLARLIELTGNRALAGFTAPKLLWLRRHEPDVYARIAHILLPKDYVRFRLTGERAIDAADASGTLLFDVARRRWSAELLELLELPAAWLPDAHECTEIGGAGDQAAAALGVGIDRPGRLSVVLGTSGVVFAALPAYAADPQARLHSFCHAVPDTWHAMGVMLSAAGSLRWLRDAARRRLRGAARRRGRMARGRRGPALRSLSRRRANAAPRSGCARRVHGAGAPPRPGRAHARRARGRRVRAARLARAARRARCRAGRRPRLRRWGAERALAAHRRLRARAPARAHRRRGGIRVRRSAARRRRGRRVRARPRRRSRPASASATWSSPIRPGPRHTGRPMAATGRCIPR